MIFAQSTMKSKCWALYEARTVKVPAEWYFRNSCLIKAIAGQPRQCLMTD